MSPTRPMAFSQQRRGSGRRGSSSFPIPKSPTVESPRTLCPRDSDAFSYNPTHLTGWYIPHELWVRLPNDIQSRLAAVQHSGAAVLTSYERLGHPISDAAGTALEQKLFPDSHALHEIRSQSMSSSSITSPVISSPTSSMSSSPALSAFGNPGPISPISLTPPEVTLNQKRQREHSFSIPLEPHDAYYATELSYLRTESLPRLRHAARKVDIDWSEAKRLSFVTQDDTTEFENWWTEKKAWIKYLDEEGKRLSVARGVSPSGLGWSGP